MRTTIQLDDDLFREVKQEAARKGRTLASFIEDALRESLARRRQAKDSPPVRLPTVKGKPLPGVDLSNNAALLDLMEADLDAFHRR